MARIGLISDTHNHLPPQVLDLFAGSGALSFEALSRGAREAVLVDTATAATEAQRTNAADLGCLVDWDDFICWAPAGGSVEGRHGGVVA